MPSGCEPAARHPAALVAVKDHTLAFHFVEVGINRAQDEVWRARHKGARIALIGDVSDGLAHVVVERRDRG